MVLAVGHANTMSNGRRVIRGTPDHNAATRATVAASAQSPQLEPVTNLISLLSGQRSPTAGLLCPGADDTRVIGFGQPRKGAWTHPARVLRPDLPSPVVTTGTGLCAGTLLCLRTLLGLVETARQGSPEQ